MSQTPQGRKVTLIVGGIVAVVAVGAIAFLIGRSSKPTPAGAVTSPTVTAAGAGTTGPGTTSKGGSTTHSATTHSATTHSSTSVSNSSPSISVAAPSTGLPTIQVSALPPEARMTLKLIASDGPYPFSRDGVVYSNIEKILPKNPSGYYHEYTVVTPGSKDRGARRVVTGKNGERFYTADHYASFKEIVS
jgi:ribonuclease T1